MNESYESAYKKLQEIVTSLESEDIELEEAIKKYEEGLELYTYCNKLLNEYDGKVKILLEENNEIVEKNFEDGEHYD